MIDQITIQGYKSFKEQTLRLDRINLLIGANGAGKSNFLSMFTLLKNIYEQRLGAYVATSGGVDKILFQGLKNTEQLSVSIETGDDKYTIALHEADGRFTVASEIIGKHCANGFQSNEISRYTAEAAIKNHFGVDRIANYIGNIHTYHFHDTGRRSPFATECHVQNDSYELYPHGENIASMLYRIKREQPLIYRRIVMVIQSVAPYFSDFYFNVSPADTMRLQWLDKFSEIIYGPNDLSDGTLRFVALTVLFMQPTLPSAIVIDEPELGLHPLAIQKLAGLMQSASSRGCQIIAATQSADLISNFEPEDIVTVNQRNGHTTLERLSSVGLEHWLCDYTLGDLWRQNIMKGGQPI